MMKMKLVLISLLLSISNLAMAEEEVKSKNIYAQVDIGLTNHGIAGRALIGVGLFKSLAVEVSSLSSGAFLFGKRYTVSTLSLANKWVISDKRSITIKAGVSDWNSESFFLSFYNDKSSGTTTMLGIDFINDYSENFSSVVTIDKYLDINLGSITAGFRLRF